MNNTLFFNSPRVRFYPGKSHFPLGLSQFFDAMNTHVSDQYHKHYHSEIKNEEHAYNIEMHVPGMGKEHIDITIEGNTLLVQSKNNENKQDATDNKILGSFRIPDTVESDAMKANLARGILTITLPKTEPTKKAIAITEDIA